MTQSYRNIYPKIDSPMTESGAGGSSPAQNEIDTSGSWSDVSDLETAHDPDLDGLEVEHRLVRSLDLGNAAGIVNVTARFIDEAPRSDSWLGSAGRNRTGTEMSRETRQAMSMVNGDRGNDTSEQGEKLKTRLMSAWNNMRYGWTVKMKTSFSYNSSIWLLGKTYHGKYTEPDRRGRPNSSVLNAMEEFKRDFTSRMWFTYRRDFPPLPGTELTTDVGWGCMLRTGQMMLAQSLILHFLGRDWRWYPAQKSHEVVYHREIIKLFCDFPSKYSPFSIHKLVEIGAKSGKKVGDWYGPASVAHVLREAMDQGSRSSNPILVGQLGIYVAQDCTVYIKDVLDVATRRPRRSTVDSDSDCATGASSEEHWRALVILIPVRLGGESLNSVYVPCVKALLASDNCLGIIGGKPKHSVYFVGWQDDKAIYLDPHFCQEAVNTQKTKDFPFHVFHCMSPRKMTFTKMDPSCTLGFYCKTKADFDQFVKEAQKISCPPMERNMYPMFVFNDGRCSDISASPIHSQRTRDYIGPSGSRTNASGCRGRTRATSSESDDFVFL